MEEFLENSIHLFSDQTLKSLLGTNKELEKTVVKILLFRAYGSPHLFDGEHEKRKLLAMLTKQNKDAWFKKAIELDFDDLLEFTKVQKFFYDDDLINMALSFKSYKVLKWLLLNRKYVNIPIKNIEDLFRDNQKEIIKILFNKFHHNKIMMRTIIDKIIDKDWLDMIKILSDKNTLTNFIISDKIDFNFKEYVIQKFFEKKWDDIIKKLASDFIIQDKNMLSLLIDNAINFNNKEIVDYLLSQEEIIKYTKFFGNYYFERMYMNGFINIKDFIFKYGQRITAEIIKDLLWKKDFDRFKEAFPFMEEVDKDSVYRIAMIQGGLDMFNFLVEKGIKPNSSWLDQIFYAKDFNDIVKKIVDMDIKLDPYAVKRIFNTGDIELTKILLEKGYKINNRIIQKNINRRHQDWINFITEKGLYPNK